MASSKLSIYFCGSIRAGRQDADVYAKIIDMLRVYGRVVTEHVGNTQLAQDMHADKVGLERDQAIFKTDMDGLHKSNYLVAEVTQTSMGVGFEVGAAWKLGIPILALYRPNAGSNISAMIRGAKGQDKFEYVEYNELEELPKILGDFFGKYINKQ